MKITQSVTTPVGWHISNNDFNNAVLVKPDEADEAVISAYTIEANMREDSIESVIRFELESYREFASDRFEVKNAPVLSTDNNKSVAIVKHIIGAADAAYQAVAYIPESKSVFVITLSTDSFRLFSESLKDFENMVQSYTVEKEKIQLVYRNTYY